jgi:hypothetical protein
MAGGHVLGEQVMLRVYHIGGSPNSCQPAMSYYSTNINP